MNTNWTLLAKVFAGEADAKELQEYEKWTHENEENKQMTDMLRKNWDTGSQDDRKISVDVDKAWGNLHNRIDKDELIPGNTGRVRYMMPPVLRVAATIILLLALGTVSYLIITPINRSVQMSASTNDEQKFGLTLPDGSNILYPLSTWI